MIVRLLVAAMMTLPTASVGAADAFLGNWAGEVREQGSDAPYPVSMAIFEQDGRLFHNSRYGEPLNCSGGGVVMAKSTGNLHFSELIVRNRAICSDGSIRVYLNGEESMIWEWFYPNGDYAARADLTKLE